MSEVKKEGRTEEEVEGDFEVVISIPEKKVGVDIPEDKIKALVELLDNLKWSKKTLLRYISTALRLRKLEKEYGKSFTALIKEYEKLSKEEVKIRYSIQQLLEKRNKIEEDLRLYMDQYNLTLEMVKRVASIIEELRKNGLNIEDLSKAVRVVNEFRKQGYDVEKIVSLISEFEELSKESERLKKEVEESRESLKKYLEERELLDKKLKEDYRLVKGLEDLKNEIDRLNMEKDKILLEISNYRRELEERKKELEELIGAKFEIAELKRILNEKKIELDSINKNIEVLRTELSELMGVENSTREIISKQKELSKKLEILEKEIKEKEEYGELLDGEIAAAYSILKLLQDPEGGTIEDLEALSHHINRLIKIKRGETIAQKPLEPYFLEKTRKALTDLIMPYIKKDFVPRWVFERVEKELKALSEKRVLLEEEIASLRRSIETRSKVEVPKPIERKEETSSILTAISEDGVVSELKTVSEGKKAKITCIYCKEHTLINLPTDDELEELASNKFKLRFKCGKCSKTYDLSPEIILRKVRGEV
ncbi:MAG: hypothetical protein RMI88_01500 [Nitrososphaerota archaeon]|nr:hypothetical protein [Nitrososphaerota archaeon]